MIEDKRNQDRQYQQIQPPCPFWRMAAYRQMDSAVLALCGRADQDTPPYADIPDFGSRLARCPWWPKEFAYSDPTILLYRQGDYKPNYVECATLPGQAGIDQLLELWPDLETRFLAGERIHTRNRHGIIIS